ncbi:MULTISPECIES: hypothetical protein [Psychrobacter]|uniref:hypothetical protein n=1 Tax=Psychrobacter TaxID=497 RepID=UPI00191B12D8|nr:MULTISPECIES: hypothetical protein [Psychrobacter]UEC27007.1 hypothetical protein LK453_13940 [Psychrobacter sanguinis]
MKRTSVRYYILDSMINVSIAALSIFAAFISILSYYILPNETILVKYVVLIVFALFVVAYLGFHIANNIHKDLIDSLNSAPLRPKVINARKPPKYYGEAIALFVTEPTEILSNDSIVSIYILANEFEELIAIGKVINVQDDKKVQVLIVYDHDLSKYKEGIMNNHHDFLEKLVIKPTVPSFIFQGDLNVR